MPDDLFQTIYEKYLKYIKHIRKEQGFISFKYNFEAHILPYFKDKRLSDLKKIDFFDWRNEIYDLKYSNSFNNTTYVNFNGFLDYCVTLGLLERNYLRDLGNFKKKTESKKTDCYTLEEFNVFIKGVDEEIYKQYFTLLFFSGLRPSEALALKFSDIDGTKINITKSLQRRGTRKIDTPKNATSIRLVQLDKKMVKDLLKLKRLYLNATDDYFIFGGTKALSTTTIDRKKQLACEKMGIRPITQHQFRHSHTSLLVNNNIAISEVSKRLGHSRISTTLDIYTHTNSEQEKRVYKKLNFLRFLGSLSIKHTLKTLFKRLLTFKP